MTNGRTRQRFAIAAIVALAFITLGLSIPVLVGGRPQTIALQNGSVQAASGDSFTIVAPVLLDPASNLTVQSGRLSIVLDRNRTPLTGEAMLALLAGGSARLTLDDATLSIDVDGRTGRGAGDAEPPTAPLLTALAKLSFSSLAIRRGVIVLRRNGGGSEVLSDVRLDISHNRSGAALTATGSFELQGRQMRLDTTLGLASDRKDVVRLPLKASIKGAFVDATIADGRLVLGDAPHILAAQAEVQSAGLRQLAGWLGGPWPGERGLGAFKAKGQLEWRDRTVTFQNASFQMDGNDATGTLTLDWGKARPSIEGTLALKQFDLTRYLGTEEKSKAGFLQRTALGWLRSVSEPGSLALPLIRHLDADVRISANEVTGGPVRLGRSAASVAVRDAKMLADLAEVEIEGDGSLRGQLTVDMGGVVPRYVMRGRLEGIDAALLTGYLLGHPAISGRASVVVDLNGTGETADQLASTLYGKLGIELPDGGALGLDVLQLMSLAQRSPELKGWGPPGKGQIRVTSLVSRFGVQSGVLLAETFKATAGDRLFTLSGDINLAARSIDAQLSLARITSTGPLAGSLTGDPLDVLSVRGPWREPSVLYSTRPGKAATPTPLPPAMPAVARQPG